MWLTMTQSSPQHRSRALIVEDEPLCALDLEALRIVFVTGYTDPDTVKRIRKEVPGAPLLPKPVWGDRLADAVKAVMTFRMW